MQNFINIISGIFISIGFLIAGCESNYFPWINFIGVICFVIGFFIAKKYYHESLD